jgi:signal transduction histidine kinase
MNTLGRSLFGIHRALKMTFSSKAIAACALVILISIGMLSFRSTVREGEDRGWVTHTHLVIEKLQTVLIDTNRAETGRRGYLLTGRDEDREEYEADINQVQRDIGEVRDLTSDNPTQQEAIRRLDAALGKELMDEVRVQIGGMRTTEEQLLARRLEMAAAGSRRMKAVIVLGNALAILILSMAGFVIHREAGRRNFAEKELRHVNEHLEQRTAELSDTNCELESFSYSVAHDLRAPLRQIAGYSSVLLQEYGPDLDAEARRYLEKVEEGARKMGRLVDDLLSLSKIGRQELALQETPLDSLLRQVVEDLAPECSGREVEWQIGSLFSAECDPALMKQVFVNLLSNAVKYTGKRERAVIQVGQMMQNDLRVVFVRDNGAGFEMQYVGKLFGVFQRLHKARDFEGTGVGLAIVQRIIRKHGGRIWAEAELDRGATFFFTLGSPESKTTRKAEHLIRSEAIYVA